MNLYIFIYYNHIYTLIKIIYSFIYLFIYYNHICIHLSNDYIGSPYMYILIKGFI